MARKSKLTAEQAAHQARRNARLAEVQEAIREGRAYLQTGIAGRRKVVHYSDATGDAVTNNSGRDEDQRTFMVCLESIKIS
jgi:3'-phosphoadenosine 5'-phosphosulfate sulfotransferase